MKAILTNLFDHKSLTRVEAREVLMNISSGKYNPSQVTAFMSVYLMRAITVEELSGLRDAMMEMSIQPQFDTHSTIDIVGTGGDGKDTFNISTLSCFVVAGAGYKVTKHGNYGVSSVSGSSDVLEALGYKFTNDNDELNSQLDKAGICFLHAPLFHPAMKSVAPVRKELGVRTFFNMLGPVVNPCKPKLAMLGVYSLEMARLYNYLLQSEEMNYSIVHSFDGYDEISLTSAFKLISKNKEMILEPEMLGLKKLKASDLHGGSSVESAAQLFKDILNVNATIAQQDVVIANSAIAIQTIEPAFSIGKCVGLAQESLKSKAALNVFNKLINDQE
ncbi:MAG: trpD [Bacteroidota bacterium]|jgi:anthranilate phosphoribosyltransferase|nr:trpD [Bacteroidota bacterium]